MRSVTLDQKLNTLAIQFQQQEENSAEQNDIFDRVYSQYKSKFNHIAFKMNNEDISQELAIALIKALRTFKLENKVKFNTYFWKVAQNHLGVLKCYKQANKRIPANSVLYLDQPVFTDNNNNSDAVSLSDIIEDSNIDTKFEDLNLEIFLEKEIFNKLSDTHVQIIKMYLRGYTMTEISRSLNMTVSMLQNRVRNIRANKAVCNKLIDYLGYNGPLKRTKQNAAVYSTKWVTNLIQAKLSYQPGDELPK